MKIFQKIQVKNITEIRFFNIPIVQYTKGLAKKNIRFFPQSLENCMLDYIINTISSQHDYVFILRAGIGEAYLLNFMLEEIITKNNIKNPCFVSTRKHYGDIFKLYFPNIPFYYLEIDNIQFCMSLLNRKIKYKGITFNTNPSTLYEIQDLVSKYEKGLDKRHYCDVVKQFNYVQNFTLQKPVEDSEINIRLEAKFLHLNLKNFVFLVPNANFVFSLSEHFCDKLIKELKSKGFDIYINSTQLSLYEAFYLAKKAKAIIGIRGGFLELLSTIDIPKYIIYTNCVHKKINNMVDLFTLKKYPFVNPNSIYEYDAILKNESEIQRDILKKLSGDLKTHNS